MLNFSSIFFFLLFVSFWGEAPMWYGRGALAAVQWFVMGGAQSALLAGLMVARWKVVRVIGWVVGLMLATLCFVNAFAWAAWGKGVDQSMLITILESNAYEVSVFADEMKACVGAVARNPIAWVAVASPVVAAFMARFIGCVVTKVTVVALAVASCGVAAHAMWGQGSNPLIVSFVNEVQEVRKVMRIAGVYRHQALVNQKYVPELSCSGITDNLIFVLGESSSARHWSALGYEWPTTPWVEANRDSLALFSDALPPYYITRRCLPNILTEKNSTTCQKDWSMSMDVLRLAGKAGYHTAWISNHERVNLYSGCIPALIDRVEHREFVSRNGGHNNDIISYDSLLLAPLRRTLNSGAHPRNFVVLHTYGSHATYSDRFPAEFALFSPADYEGTGRASRLTDELLQKVADYDNAILYTDHILSRIVQIVNSSGGRNIVVYLSDHSEDVCDIDCHYGHAARKPFVKVPMLIWASDEWKSANPILWYNIVASRDLPVATENSFHLIHSLLGIESPLYDAQLDIASPDYNRWLNRYFDDKEYLNF